jgi:hypothetical protein
MKFQKSALRALMILILFTTAIGLADPPQGFSTGSLAGTVTDPSGAVVPNTKITVSNPVSRFAAEAVTDASGQFHFRNLPFNHYHVTAVVPGFTAFETDVDLHTAVPVDLPVQLQLATSSQSVTVEATGQDLLENVPTSHVDIDQSLIDRLPTHSESSPLSSAITLSTPGVTADSNGMFHPLGEHADTSFSLDTQPITDQQSKVFSNQISPDSIQSMEVITGVPPAEFGDKNSLVVRITTKSGLGIKKPTGSVSTSYGSFGTSTVGLNLLNGSDHWGNFISLSGLNGGRFLDTPEFQPMHAHGNSQSAFDRLDFQPNEKDQIHFNFGYSRSWFQIPNDYDQQAAGQDQRQLINTFNVSPSWTHLFSQATLLTVTTFIRRDAAHYFPTADRFNDLPATLAQNRHLTNAGIKADISYVKGHHNLKVGGQFTHTFLSEFFNLGLTDPTFNAVCADANGIGVAAPGITDPAACAGSGFAPNPGFEPALLAFDLTRGGSLFNFRGRTDIKQEAAYAQDSINFGNLNVNLGLRLDNYNGLTSGTAAQPRAGLAYNIKRTGTVLRVSYGRMFETPYNENLIVSSTTGTGGLGSGSIGAVADQPLPVGRRNQFNAGLQQSLGKWVVIDGEYFWKFTQNAYDFDTLFNTPLAFPISWRKSKIDGFSLRVSMPAWKGITAYTVMGHTRARFFGPEEGGILFNSPVSTGAFRIDHDQVFEQTTNVQYQPFKAGPWFGLTWRYDSGEVAGAIPDLASLLALSPVEQAQVGFFCGNTFATRTSGITSCAAPFPQWGTTQVNVPEPGTENDDSNPPRVKPRNLFDASIGIDNLFHGDHKKWSLRLTAVNLTNKVALYNFLSTFSGTHFVPPRTYSAELGFNF